MGKRDYDCYHERDVALYEAYKKARNKLIEESHRRGEFWADIHTRAIKMAIETPQPRFWITQDRTYRLIRAIKKGKLTNTKWPTRRKMNRELLAAYERLVKTRMFKGMPYIFIASFLTFEPASGFFMSYHRALRAVNEQRRQASKRSNTLNPMRSNNLNPMRSNAPKP